MSRVVLTSRVGADGVFTLRVPLGKDDANRTVRVAVETADAGPAPPILEPEAWARFVAERAGSIRDPTFERPEQGEVERRDDLG
jgi:hypothetical protein